MINLDGYSLTIDDVIRVAADYKKVGISKAALEKVNFCRDYVERVIREGRTVYGLTTGFGKFSNVTIPADKIAELQENLIISHCTGVGKNFSIAETRAAILLRANVLAKGYSGIKASTLQCLISLLNKSIHPCIPEQGSVGASGDLAPLSHLALIMLGQGEAEYQGSILSGAEALKRAEIKPIKLSAKEGLALNNGTQIMTAVMALNIARAKKLSLTADICAALSADSLLSTPAPFDELVHNVRPHKGQINTAKNLRYLLKNSELRDSHLKCTNVQDPYSIRCVPQVHGAVKDAMNYVKNVIDIEINSATDNPLIFPEEDKVISGGNFHGEPVAFAADTLAFSISELGSISERRMEQICNPALNRGLNAFLAPRPGLDSGYMIAHVTATSLVSENKTLSYPASVDSIPTSANQEDHVSMGTIGAIKARNIIENLSYILAIELMLATQAIDNRKLKTSSILEQVKDLVRSKVKPLDKDRNIGQDIKKIKQLVDSGQILEIVNQEEQLKL